MLGVDPDALARVGIVEPSELHDRTPGGVENPALDVPGGAVDSIVFAAHDGDLGRDRRLSPCQLPTAAHKAWCRRVERSEGCGIRSPFDAD